jgi:hypothetical protein
MRTLAVSAIAVIFGLLGISAAKAEAPNGQAKALLKLTLRDPVTIHGAGFQPRERVRVTLVQPSLVRVVRAGRGGGFVVAFEATATHRCDLVRVVALGGSGTRAVLKILPSPACLIDRMP